LLIYLLPLSASGCLCVGLFHPNLLIYSLPLSASLLPSQIPPICLFIHTKTKFENSSIHCLQSDNPPVGKQGIRNVSQGSFMLLELSPEILLFWAYMTNDGTSIPIINQICVICVICERKKGATASACTPQTYHPFFPE